MRIRTLSALLVCLLAGVLSAQAPYLVSDIRTKPEFAASSTPFFIARNLGTFALFTATKSEDEVYLWRSDGTAAGTFPLIRIADDVTGVTGIFTDGNLTWLSVVEPGGTRIWRTDGTVAGTVPLTAFSPTPIHLLTVAGEKIFYLASAMRDLWVFDGSQSRMLATVRTGQVRSTSPRIIGNTLYLGTESGLWKSDGTEGGTIRLTSTSATRLSVLQNRLYFAGTDEAGAELWTTDGTAAGTNRVVDLNPGGGSTFGSGSAMVALGNTLLFAGSNGELGISDGTAAGTRIVRNGAAPENDFVVFSVVNGIAFFGFDDDGGGVDLWRSDGTEAGTRKVHGFAEPIGVRSSILVAGATRVFFLADDETGARVYQSDGTEAGTRPVTGTPIAGTAPRSITAAGDRLFFSNDDGPHGAEPWTSDGTPAGTYMIANLAEEAAGSSFPRDLLAGNGRLYFIARSDDGTDSIWRTDGTAQGTAAVGTGLPLATVGNTLFVKRMRSQLWRIDEAGNAFLLRDFDPGSHLREIGPATVIDGRFYFYADDGSGEELWMTDGTAAGTVRLTDRFADGVSTPVELAGRVYGIAHRGELYDIGTTAEGTRPIAIAENTTSPWAPLIAFKGALYFFAESQSVPESVLWRFSGSTGDAVAIHRFPGGSYIKRPWVASTGDELLFTWQQDSSHMNQLWKTDGTAEGTVMIREFALGGGFTTFTQPVSLGGRVVFGVDDGIHGIEPWVSDGTPEGTLLLRDIHASRSSEPAGFFVADGVAYFAATGETHGRELWRTDGSPAGTQLVADIASGTGDSSPAGMTRAGDLLYFSATTEETGRELWAMPLPALATISAEDVRVFDSAGQATVTVRLSRASLQRITVRYATADDTAAAGRDYNARSGTLTFEPGETVKTIAVPILDRAEPANIRVATVRVESDDAVVLHPVAAIVIEESGLAADVAVSVRPGSSRPIIVVTNHGPSAASNVRLCAALLPENEELICLAPAHLQSGESFQTVGWTSADLVVARVTLWEHDPNLSNNQGTWLGSGLGALSFYVSPATPRAGETGTIAVNFYSPSQAATITLTSSDPAVLSVPPNVVIPAGEALASTTFTALSAGTATITARTGSGSESVTVRVVGADEIPRSAPIGSLEAFTAWDFGEPEVLTARVAGITASGARPTGHVTFLEDDREIGQAPVLDGRATLIVRNATPGPTRRYTAVYSGDANFFDTTLALAHTIFVHRGIASIRAFAVAGTSDAVITVRGIPGYAPTGTVTVPPGTATLTPVDPFTSTATITVPAGARTVTVTYSGDTYYDRVTVTIPVDTGRRRAVGQ